jgi:hypothetical protein
MQSVFTPWALALLLVPWNASCSGERVVKIRSNNVTISSGSASSADVRGSGKLGTKELELGAFDVIRVEGYVDLKVRVVASATAPLVRVIADDNVLDALVTEVENGVLRIGVRDGTYTFEYEPTVEVELAKLARVEASGSNDLDLQGFERGRFELLIEGAGEVRGRGQLDELELTLKGAANAALYELHSKRTKLRLAGAGKVQVHASESLDAELNGAGIVNYRGNPKQVQKNVDGVGWIRPD